jgi:TonB-dependent starch-binding outer membrane protein SusC
MRLRLLDLKAYYKLMLLVVLLLTDSPLFAQALKDTTVKVEDTIKVVETNGLLALPLSSRFNNAVNTLPMHYIHSEPYISLQQMVKGNLAGVYVQEPTGEPGTEQSIFVHGISSPLLSKRDLFDNQAVVFLNGIPLAQDNPFAYEIQKYDFNRIGPATNLLAAINQDNIESIEVVKDPVSLALLGPIASNGAIWVTTKNAHSGFREISINSYFGVANGKYNVEPVNASYENLFRKPFYDRYGTTNDRLNYPPYLRDSTNVDYYGPANWTDLYYKQTSIYSTDLSLTGGTDRANFRFFAGLTKNANGADNTSLNRYTGSFFINVAPLKWLTVSSMINYNRLDRERNRNIRDRLAEVRYLPDLTNPLTPNKSLYGNYLNEFKKSIDNNSSNVIQGYVAISANYKKVFYRGRIAFDYDEGIRDVFWPTTLLEGNNFVSNYFGYNQRLVITNSLGYEFNVGKKQKILLQGGQNFMSDFYKYDYAYAYNSPNDFIKINVVNGDPNAGDYLTPNGFNVYYFPSKMQSRLVSFFGNATYSFNDIIKLTAVARRDGSSNMQPDNRWFTGYSAGVEWDIKKHLLNTGSILSTLSLTGSWARIGRLLNDDRFNAGPQYRVDLGWPNEPTLGSYLGFPGISRPYTNGWVGYGIPWSFSDRLSIGTRIGIANDRVKLGVDVYNRDDKQIMVPLPVPEEWGYTGAYKSGMSVNNQGIDFSFVADIVRASAKTFSWSLTGNLNYNKNKLKALPGGANELVMGTNKLEVGKPIDAFWLLQNKGIYATDGDVPTNPVTNEKLSYHGVALKAGDPRWVDVNGDFVINDKDKVLKGNYLPRISGGFGTVFGYQSFTVDLQFYFSLRRNLLNQYASSRLDFINTESSNNINSVKEITFWEKKMDLSQYPLYNPWSSVIPYQLDQDLFLDNGSFMNLRSVSVSYDFIKSHRNNKNFKNFILYLTATNLFTVTPFNGDNPELTNYNGVYTGYGLPIPRSMILGIKVNM